MAVWHLKHVERHYQGAISIQLERHAHDPDPTELRGVNLPLGWFNNNNNNCEYIWGRVSKSCEPGLQLAERCWLVGF